MQLILVTFVLLSLATTISADARDYEEVPDFSIITEGVDPDLVTTPGKDIDYPGCMRDLNWADKNGDGKVSKNEYLGFVQEYGKRRCFETDRLTLQQHTIFNSLACMCESLEGRPEGCCLGANAHIETAGALTSARTQQQQLYLTTVCKITDGTIESECPPAVTDRGPPLEWVTAAAAPGLSPAAKWGLIGAAIALLLLLLFLCCCCCVLKKRRQQQEEEEAEEALDAKNSELETAMEGYPESMESYPESNPEEDEMVEEELMEEGGVSPMPPFGAMIPPKDDDEGYEEDGRKRRGNNMGDDPEEDESRALYAGGQLPPPEDPDPERLQLRPIDPKEPEIDPPWEQPGRDINFPKDSDEYSAGEVDHYDPDGGVHIPEREAGLPVGPAKPQWERLKKDEPEEVDLRKHRIQSGLGEGEVWNKLNEGDEVENNTDVQQGGAFDWVIESALGVLDTADAQGSSGEDSSGEESSIAK